MPHRIRRLASIMALSCTLAVMGVAGAPPASAAVTACANPINTKTFALPGKPDVKVEIDLCVYRDDNGDRIAMAWINWDGTNLFIGGRRFHYFALETRLEWFDGVWEERTCDYTSQINSQERGVGTPHPCRTPWATFTGEGGWTADATVYYDIANDGEGRKWWDLRGSPAVR